MTLIKLATCESCLWRYPEHLINKLTLSGSIGGVLCPICALKLVNQFCGINRAKFDGELAEQYRQEAIRWRGKNPHHGMKSKEVNDNKVM